MLTYARTVPNELHLQSRGEAIQRGQIVSEVCLIHVEGVGARDSPQPKHKVAVVALAVPPMMPRGALALTLCLLAALVPTCEGTLALFLCAAAVRGACAHSPVLCSALPDTLGAHSSCFVVTFGKHLGHGLTAQLPRPG